MNVTVLVDFENDSFARRSRSRMRSAHAVGRPARYVGVARRPVTVGGDGRLQADRRQPAARRQRARRARPSRLRAVRIVVSGGFTVEKILEFEENDVPVDAYGVGSSLIRGSNDFTARHRDDRRRAVREGRPPLPAQPTTRARHVNRVLWDVDTQFDFVSPAGKLYVPGAEAGAAGDGATGRGGARRPACRTSRAPTTTS